MSINMLEIPQELLDNARLSVDDLKRELAVSLYAQGRLPVGKAREFADMPLWEFRQLLALRHIPPRYDADDLTDDLVTIEWLKEQDR